MRLVENAPKDSWRAEGCAQEKNANGNHKKSEQVRDLVQSIDRDHVRLDVLVNDIWGGDTYLQFNTKLWEHDLAGGLRMLRPVA